MMPDTQLDEWDQVNRSNNHRGESIAKLRHQLLRQRRNNPRPVVGTFLPKDIASDEVSSPPTKEGEGYIYGRRSLATGFGNQLTQLSDPGLLGSSNWE